MLLSRLYEPNAALHLAAAAAAAPRRGPCTGTGGGCLRNSAAAWLRRDRAVARGAWLGLWG